MSNFIAGVISTFLGGVILIFAEYWFFKPMRKKWDNDQFDKTKFYIYLTLSTFVVGFVVLFASVIIYNLTGVFSASLTLLGFNIFVFGAASIFLFDAHLNKFPQAVIMERRVGYGFLIVGIIAFLYMLSIVLQ